MSRKPCAQGVPASKSFPNCGARHAFRESVNGSREYVASMMAVRCTQHQCSRGLRHQHAIQQAGQDDQMTYGVHPMSHEAKTATNAAQLFRRSIPALLATIVAAVLTACSSGSGGTDVTIRSGQSADPVTLDFPVFY